jgi:hypothetical protein
MNNVLVRIISNLGQKGGNKIFFKRMLDFTYTVISN